MAEKLPKSKRTPHRPLKLGDTAGARLRSRRTTARPSDVEKGIVNEGQPHGRATVAAAAAQELVGQIDDEDLDMYKLLQEQYNYTTIDHAPNCKSMAISRTHKHRGPAYLIRL